MRVPRILGLFALSLLIVLPAHAAERRVKLKVKGWQSAACVCATEDSLKAVKGVKTARGDLQKREVTVEYDDAAVQLFALEEAVRAAGYEPVEAAKK